ncbi:MAG: hypothetical protein GQ574_09720 [Crocinitomix sp.]|nr:hypothetical protein [Crocinitomix sp.]
MKNLAKSITVLALIATVMVACKKEEIATNEVDETTETKAAIWDIDPVAYGPDLVVTRVTSTLPIVSPSACGGTMPQTTCGVNYTLIVDVTNVGNATASGYYELELDKPTGNMTTQTFTSPTGTLAAGATHTFNIGPAPFGGCQGVAFTTQDLVMTADIFNDIRETNESNNTARAYRYCGD